MIQVACAGILVADTFCGPMARLPHAGELYAVERMPARAGGCAANVAIDLAKQGVATEIFGRVGDDAAAEVVLSSLRHAKVKCDRVTRDPKLPTSTTAILLVTGEDRRYIHAFGANAAFNVEEITDAWLTGLKVFYLGGLFALPGLNFPSLGKLLERCRRLRIVTVVDVVVPQTQSGMGGLAPLLPHIDYFLPNDDESQRLTGLATCEQQVQAFQGHGAHTVVITRGVEGAIAARAGQSWHIGSFPATVVDPSGSGDAFTSGIITGITRGWDLPQMLRYGAALGASATRAIGTTDGVFTAAEAEAFLASNQLKVTPSMERTAAR